MAETKPKQTDALRTPKAKKKLGLSVPPALRLPHDDLIVPLADQHPKKEGNLIKQASMPSLTSQTRHTQQTIDSKENSIKSSNMSMPSLTSQTRHTQPEGQPISPVRDFTKVANSIGRQAVPAGLFTGKSKQLYDCLYSLTRGAVVPTRSVRISRPKLMKKSGIGSRVTFEANIERLVTVGLLDVRQIVGEHEGNEYAVLLPEELPQSMPSQTSQTSQTSLTGYAQKLDRLVSLETSQTRHTLNSSDSTISTEPKTSFKTIEKNDDEAFAGFADLMRQAVKEVTGKSPVKFDKDRWSELAELLSAELKIAAARTNVSSAPAFLTEHLRRRLWKLDRKPGGEAAAGKSESKISSEQSSAAPRNCPDCGGTGFYYPQGYESGVAKCRHARAVAGTAKETCRTDSEIAEQASIIKELLDSGYTLEQAEKQFAAGLGQMDWQKICDKVAELKTSSDERE